MKNNRLMGWCILICLSACQVAPPMEIQPSITPQINIQQTITKPVATMTQRATSPSVSTLTPKPSAHSLEPTSVPEKLKRPIFLNWPLPAYIGLARISQYPNTPWTCQFLGLNPGRQCPLMFGYLDCLAMASYWRNTSIPIEQDKAQADPHNFNMIECYSTEGQPGYNGHEATDIKAPSGTPVYAASDGLVEGWTLNGLNTLLILKHCPKGSWDQKNQCVTGQWYTTYMHIILEKSFLEKNKVIHSGDKVGVVYDQGDNSHLHFEVGVDQRSYKNYVNPWGQDESPWLSCMWLEQALCPTIDPTSDLFLFSPEQNKWVIKIGSRSDESLSRDHVIKKIRLDHDYIALLDDQNKFYLYQINNLGFPEILINGRNIEGMINKITDFDISGQRLIILDSNKDLWLSEEVINGDLVKLAYNVTMFSISNSRLGYLDSQGALWAMETNQPQDWVKIADNVRAFQLVDNRIAYLDSLNSLFVNEGAMNSKFELMANNVNAFQVTNERLGIMDNQNNLLVKSGNLRAEWVPQMERIKTFQMRGSEIWVQLQEDIFRFKNGDLYQPWVNFTDPAKLVDFIWPGNFPVFAP